MIFQSRADIGSRGSSNGIAGELDALKRDLATMLITARADLSKATGDPAGSRRIGRQQTLARMDDYERPEARQALQGVSDGELVRLTKESVRTRKKAMEAGTWQAPQTYLDAIDPPPPPEIPFAPPPPPILTAQMPLPLFGPGSAMPMPAPPMPPAILPSEALPLQQPTSLPLL